MSNKTKTNNNNKESKIKSILDRYQNLTNFLSQDTHVSTKPPLINYIKNYFYISRNNIDKFFEDDSKTLLAWYMEKNPNFKKMNEIQIEMPEFKILLATIAFNCIKILLDNKYPRIYNNSWTTNKHINFRFNNNSKPSSRLHKILQKINDMVMPDNGNIRIYYKDVIDLCVKFMDNVINTSVTNDSNNNTYPNKNKTKKITTFSKITNCKTVEALINKYMNSPIIIFPTFNQLSMPKVIKSMSAPILNCNIFYTNRDVHGNSANPCTNFHHDLRHGEVTHYNIYENSDTIEKYKNAYKNVNNLFFTNLYKALKNEVEVIQEILFTHFHEFDGGVVYYENIQELLQNWDKGLDTNKRLINIYGIDNIEKTKIFVANTFKNNNLSGNKM